MNKLLLLFSLLWLFACSSPVIEDGDDFPTRPADTPTAVSPATAPPTPTLAPSATATVAVTEATVVFLTPTLAPATPTVEPESIRIQFESGATSATLNGRLAASDAIEYLAWAAEGQHAHIEIVSLNNVANFSLVGMSDGQPYKRLENEDRFWDGTLPQSQDYRIRVHTLEEADFTLIVTIDPLGENVLQPVWPVVDATSGFLLGGSHNGQWLDVWSIMPSLQDGERSYQLYAGSTFEGQITASPPTASQVGPCGGTPAVTFSPDRDPAGMIAIVARWEAAPRQPQSLSLDVPEYQDVVATLLQAEGIADPEVQLTNVDRIDLEEDGVDEVLITAARLSGLGQGLPTAAAGDYSLVVLRKLIDGEVINIPVAVSVFTEAVELADPVQFNVLAILDLNGDGKLEIVVEGWYYEGRFVTVYESIGQEVQPVLTVGCRL